MELQWTIYLRLLPRSLILRQLVKVGSVVEEVVVVEGQ